MLYVKALLEVDPNRARIVWCALPGLELRLGLLRRLSEAYVDGRGLADLERLLTRVVALSARRDLVAQSAGGVDSQGGQPVFLSDARTSGSLGRETYTLEQMEAWPAEVAALESDLLQWLPTLTNLVHATPRAHRVAGPVRR